MIIAAVAGLISGLALVAGAAIGWFARVPRVVIAAVMAFGAGVLISALAFDLMEEATETGGLLPSIAGLVLGAVLYFAGDLALERASARRHRARSGAASSGSGLGIALGALLDGIPETAVQGVQSAGGALPLAVLIAVVISNVPEGLSSTADMRASGRSARYVFGLWAGIAGACTIAALLGAVLLGDAGGEVRSVVTSVAAGAILTMLCNTMIPEAFREMRAWTGVAAVAGFLVSYVVHAASA
ncbi:ZIP family metal transporter [Homoserinibacter sp. YIM 151385]|uniref:ZIP family metal transporter n=1 Tax=Homoserinibacter sp. YIM 151385 TaxID=2985506 RepID=UPI0022F02CBA|nr:ZIP family zinc transporter [Homoserinibacter sp. YIM 151385]WBU37581.1 ZIP family zinc transporter [Homoserinibacter sp. YIM 151385]